MWITTVLLLVLTLFGLAWYPCGCDSSPNCGYCTGTPPTTITVTLTGAYDLACSDCDTELNTTHVLTLNADCHWEKIGAFCGGYEYLITAKALVSGGFAYWRVEVRPDYPGGGGWNLEWYSGSSTFDCTATRTLSVVSGSGATTRCYGLSVTCQVN